MINHCDRCTTHLSDTDISFALFNLYLLDSCAFWVIVNNTLNSKDILEYWRYIKQNKRYFSIIDIKISGTSITVIYQSMSLTTVAEKLLIWR
jgi:hypothetical protein